MKIIYRKGDLLKGQELYIAHGCNAQGVMGSGIAKAIKDMYPECYMVYTKSKLCVGDTIVYYDPQSGRTILNMVTQEFYGRDKNKVYVDYKAIEKCMKFANSYLKQNQAVSIGLPKIGAGLGNGDWEVISGIIESSFVNIQPNVYIL